MSRRLWRVLVMTIPLSRMQFFVLIQEPGADGVADFQLSQGHRKMAVFPFVDACSEPTPSVLRASP